MTGRWREWSERAKGRKKGGGVRWSTLNGGTGQARSTHHRVQPWTDTLDSLANRSSSMTTDLDRITSKLNVIVNQSEQGGKRPDR